MAQIKVLPWIRKQYGHCIMPLNFLQEVCHMFSWLFALVGQSVFHFSGMCRWPQAFWVISHQAFWYFALIIKKKKKSFYSWHTNLEHRWSVVSSSLTQHHWRSLQFYHLPPQIRAIADHMSWTWAELPRAPSVMCQSIKWLKAIQTPHTHQEIKTSPLFSHEVLIKFLID